MRNRRSTNRRLYLPAPVRLQGLATLLTAYALRVPAGSVSHRRRSWDSPFGAWPPGRSPRVTARSSPRTVLPDRSSRRRSDKPELPGRGFWDLTLPGVPVPVGRYLTRRHAGGSLGLRPFRVHSRGPRPGSPRGLLSHAWRVPRLPGAAPASQSIDRPPPGPGSSACKHGYESDDPRRVLAPVQT